MNVYIFRFRHLDFYVCTTSARVQLRHDSIGLIQFVNIDNW